MLHSWNLNASDGNPVRPSTGRPAARSEKQYRDTVPTPRFARKSSTTNSLFSSRRITSTELHGWLKKLQISELQFDKFPTPSPFSCWKIRFQTKVCACSSSPMEAMWWIKEVEMVDSVDDSKSSHSIQGYTHFPNFETLDARLASALNKIIQNSYFKIKVSLEQKAQKEDRFLRGRQIADYFQVTGVDDTVLDYADSLSVTLRDDDVQEFDTRWDEVLLSMSKIPLDDILASLCKLRIRESDQLKNRIRIISPWNSSEENDARLSKIEIDGEEKHRWETQIAKLWRQKWEN